MIKREVGKKHIAKLIKEVAAGSPDPSTKVGCILFDLQGNILAHGHNTFPANSDHSKLTFNRPDKYFTIIHAEMKALSNKSKSSNTDIPYGALVTQMPCTGCLKHLIDAGVREVYYLNDSVMKRIASEDEMRCLSYLVEAANIVFEKIGDGDV